MLFSSPLAFFIIFPGLLLSLSLHEYAHCWVADKLGDPTARAKGRLTLDPRVHLDPLGVIMILFTRFGWGKPAPVDPYNLKNPVKDMALIAVAGPLTNVTIATILAIILKIGLFGAPWFQIVLIQLIFVNIMLAVFNLVPVYPLDGSRILTAILPKSTALEYEEIMHRYGTMIIIFLIFPWNGVSPISRLLSPVINFVAGILV